MTRIWRRLTSNLGWKLASVLLSVLLWFAMVGEPELVAIQPIPLLYRNLPKGLLLVSDAPDQIRAELRGPSGKLTRESLSEVFAAVDLAGVNSPGTQTFTLSESDFTLPQGVSFLRAVPSQVSLHFDHMMTKTVPVLIQVSGTLPHGYRLAGRSGQPETLQVAGPEARVSLIQSAETDPVNLNGLTQDADIKVNAFVSDARVQFTAPPVIKVHLTVVRTDASQ